MDLRSEHMRRQFVESLTGLIDHGVESLDEATVANILWEFATDLDPESQRRSCRLTSTPEGRKLSICYSTALALEQDIEAFTQAQGLMVDVEPAPPLMEEIDIVIGGDRLDVDVELRGRAVHISSGGVAVELFSMGPQKERKLRRLPIKMRESAPTIGEASRFDTSFSAEVSTVIEESSSAGEDDDCDVPVVDQLIVRPETVEQRWSLEGGEVDEMLMEVATTDGYGFLELVADDFRRHYVIHYGRLIAVRSRPPMESERLLMEKLLSMGLVEAEEVERAGVLASIHKIARQDALVDMGCVSVEQLLNAINERLVDELHRIRELEVEEARLYLLEHRPSLRLRRSAVCLVAELTRKMRSRFTGMTKERLESMQTRFSDCRVVLASQLAFEIERLDLSVEEQRFVEVILAEPRSLSELRRISNLRFEDTLIMLFVLDELGLLARKEASRRLPEHEVVDGLYHRLSGDDHFQVLGIHWSAHDEEVESAYQKMEQRLAVPDRVERDLSDKLEALRRRLSQAYAVLSKKKRRRQYRDENIDRFAINNGLKIYENKVSSLSMRNDKTELLDVLRRIVELKPGDRKRRRELQAVEQHIEENSQS